MIAYHDTEWGVPVHDDRALFEFLTLEGAQAGLSWQTILNKRDAYREAFARFDPARVARFDRRRIEALLRDPGIVRNRLKIESTVSNARAVLEVQKRIRQPRPLICGLSSAARRSSTAADRAALVPASTPVSDAHVQGAQAARLSLRRLDDLLRVHAGDGHGQRPPDRLLPPRAGRSLTD